MKKRYRSIYNEKRLSRLAALSVNYNVRYDGQYDDNGGKLLLALLAHTGKAKRIPAAERKRNNERRET